MNTHAAELAQRLLGKSADTLSAREKHVLQRFTQRVHVSRDVAGQFGDERSFGQRVADRVAAFGGSWTFILLFGGVLVAWVVLNSVLLARHGTSFDPYPYILLNLFLSMLAALQAPVIMMSQNRLSQMDRLNAAHDYEVNLKAELEILALHSKLDELRERQWAELLALQREQIELLTRLSGRAANTPSAQS